MLVPDTTLQKRKQNQLQIAIFLVICFGFSWIIALILWKLGGLSAPLGGLMVFVYMWGPALAALICTWIFDRKRWKQALGFTSWPKWSWAGAVALVGLVIVGSTGISMFGQGVHWVGFTNGLRQALETQNIDPDTLALPLETLVLLQFAVGVPLGIALNGVLLLSEELGWRGWLYDRWRHLGFWCRNLVIGFVWGLWHAPIIAMGHNYPGQPISGIFLMILFCMLLAPIVGWLREIGKSVFAASIFHGSINALAGVGLLVIGMPDMPWRGVVGIGGFVMLALTCAGLYFLRRYQGRTQAIRFS